MRVDVTCTTCGARRRLDVGSPGEGQALDEYLYLVRERLTHRASFTCFGGHTELRPPLPDHWRIHWETLGE